MQMWANSHRNLKIFSARFQKLEKTISPTNKKFPRKNPKSKPISKETKNSAISNFDWHSKCTYAQETWRRSCLRRTQRRIEKKPQWTGIGWKRERTFSWFHPLRFFCQNPPSIAHELRLGSNLQKIVRSVNPAMAILGVVFGAERNLLAILWDLLGMLLAAILDPTASTNAGLCLACLRNLRLAGLPKSTLVSPSMVDHMVICQPDVVDALARHPLGLLATDRRLDRAVVIPSGLFSYLACDRQKLASSIRSSVSDGLRDRLDQLRAASILHHHWFCSLRLGPLSNALAYRSSNR